MDVMSTDNAAQRYDEDERQIKDISVTGTRTGSMSPGCFLEYWKSRLCEQKGSVREGDRYTPLSYATSLNSVP